MNGSPFTAAADPLDLEIEPGLRVRDLPTREECTAAVMRIDMEIDGIIAQIADAEANPSRRSPGWRTRAQSAIRWKKRVRAAINAHATAMAAGRPHLDDKRQVILDTIRFEIGADEFERLVAVAKSRYPHLFGGSGIC